MEVLKRGPVTVYAFKPQPDITPFELARIMPLLIEKDAESIENLPEECLRHFKKR
jgi:hypothetical protein